MVNIALWNGHGREYYIASVSRNGTYFAGGKRVSEDGRLLQVCAQFHFDNQCDAERKCRDLAKTKCRKGGYVPVELDRLPKAIQQHLAVPPDMQLTPEEMVELLTLAKCEYYVTLKDVSGIEEWFDVGVQYIGYTTDDKEYVKVHDRFGTLRECFMERVAHMEPTERCLAMAERGHK